MGSAASTSAEVECGSYFPQKSQGDQLFQQGDFAGAVYWYSLAIQSVSSSANYDGASEERTIGVLLSNRSAAFMFLNSPVHALEDAKAVIEKCPKWVKGYFRAGMALLQLGRRSEAIDQFNKALLLEPTNQSVIQKLQEAKDGFRAFERGQGHCFTWGSGQNGSLGLGDTSDKENPRLVDELRGKYITDVACGIAHTLAVTAAGEVFAWGRNTESACGIPKDQNTTGAGDIITAPSIVPGLLGIHIDAVACGAGHSVAVTDHGVVYCWGLNQQGQCGVEEPSVLPVPQVLDVFEGTKITATACGIAHTLFMDSHNEVWGCGWNNVGQLGLGHDNNCYAPTKIATESTPISHIACGGGHTCVISQEGELWVSGSGTCGQLGLGTEKDIFEFEKVGDFLSYAFVACGEEFTVAITKERTVYTFGLGIAGQMGDGSTQNSAFPKKVEEIADKKVEFVACSQGQVMAITHYGECYTWGTPGPYAHMVAMDPSVIISKPQKVGILAKKNIQALVCGRKHYCAVTVWTYSPFCTLSGLPDEVEAGKRLKFIIHSRDNMANDRTSGGEVVQAIVLCEPDDPESMLISEHYETQDVEIFDEMDGKYSGTTRLKITGVHSFQVSICGMPIQGSPFEVKVIPGAVSPAHCTTCWEGSDFQQQAKDEEKEDCILVSNVNGSIFFTVTLRDAYGNRCINADDEVFVYLSRQLTSEINSSDVAVFDHGPFEVSEGGKVTCSISGITTTGMHLLEVCINSKENPVKESPFKLNVVPGSLDLSKCYCDGEGLSRGIVGNECLFRLYLRDSFGNDAQLHDDSLLKSSISSGTYDISHYALLYIHQSDPTKPLQCKIKQKGKGWYELSYSVVVASLSCLKVLIGNEHVPGSPFSPDIQPQCVSPSMSTLQVPKELIFNNTDSKTNSNENAVTVMLRDMYGNKTAEIKNAVIEMTLQTGDSVKSIHPHSTNDGKYVYNIGLLQESLDTQISATIDDQHVMRSPCKLNELPDSSKLPKNDPILEQMEKIAASLEIDEAELKKEKARRKSDSFLKGHKSNISSEELKKLEKLKREELTRKRAKEALKREQTKRKAQREERRKKASCRRTGGGFVIQYSQDI